MIDKRKQIEYEDLQRVKQQLWEYGQALGDIEAKTIHPVIIQCEQCDGLLETLQDQTRRTTAAEIYTIVDERCDPEIDICDGRLYAVGYQAALQDIKKCLEERFGEEIKK